MELDWEQVVIDARGPQALGRWWAAALDWVVTLDTNEEFEIRPSVDATPGMIFVPVEETKTTKNRVHPDFRPHNQQAEVDRLLLLGAGRGSGAMTVSERR